MLFVRIGILFPILTSCSYQEESSMNASVNRYSHSIYPIHSFIGSTRENANLFVFKDIEYLARQYQNQILVIDIKKDSIVQTVQIPNEVTGIKEISFCELDCGTFLTENSIWFFKVNKWQRIPFEVFGNGIFIPALRGGILYYQELNSLLAVFYDINFSAENDSTKLKRKYLLKYDLGSDETHVLPFYNPKKYWDGKFRDPIYYLSKKDKKAVISLSLDENVYILDLLTNKVETLEVSLPISNLTTLPDYDKSSRAASMDYLQILGSRLNNYGFAYLDSSESRIIRLLKPSTPPKLKNGNYFSRHENGYEIIIQSKKQKDKTNLYLQSGYYKVPKSWSYNPSNGSLFYRNFISHGESNKKFFSQIDFITPFEY